MAATHIGVLGVFWLCVVHVTSFTGFRNLDKTLILDLRDLDLLTDVHDRNTVAVIHGF